ncbi:ATP-citrate synthase-like [Planoprotostelium fungivorum]|uniref:ATP-citrate synthase n=1 Tax=Planoprotostelium fungivorum TaxID=1890364 RepID=A0A2P6N1H8_9EUKA|nr:ATP-citrate synthase-like [Planoprotostelium fungivorum]
MKFFRRKTRDQLLHTTTVYLLMHSSVVHVGRLMSKTANCLDKEVSYFYKPTATMSQKAIREADGKRLLKNYFGDELGTIQFVAINEQTSLNDLPASNSWLNDTKLVAKPDQLIKRRGKLGLVKLNATYPEVCQWIQERKGKEIQVEAVSGPLDTFIVEPFVPHNSHDEYYVSITSVRGGDQIYFYHEGGVDVGDVDAKAEKCFVSATSLIDPETIMERLLHQVSEERRPRLAGFISKLFTFYRELGFSLIEINPVVVVDDQIYVIDLAAKLDQTADFEMSDRWGDIQYPAPFGRKQTKEERYISALDAKTGASLKLTILNSEGRVWTMVAGGGASVIYADTISDLGYGEELANYGEYSGDPNESLTYEYAKTVIDLMTRNQRKDKVLIIGGGIANFTNVAETFKGIIRAIQQYQDRLIQQGVKIYVRRGGPNYQSGLQMMTECGRSTGVHIEVFGPETHITSAVSYALGQKTMEQLLHESQAHSERSTPVAMVADPPQPAPASENSQKTRYEGLFTPDTTAFIYGMQAKACQNMLDFDHVCGRAKPSVTAIIYPFGGNHFTKFYYGTNEILIPVYSKMSEAVQKHPEVTVMVNFASFRSVYASVNETLDVAPQIRTIAIIAEGVPEQRTKLLIAKAKSKGVTIIGPATVGGIKPGCFRIGNTGGMIDNVIASKLYRPGSVAYVSRSGGMSNELNNIISRHSDGVYEGVSIGGDRYPGSTFIEHLLRYESDPGIKILVLLGEVGGVEEYEICDAVKCGKIKKPIIGWCIGTCARIFPYEVQFGHAGASAHGSSETAEAKNAAMKEAGVIVPTSFEEFGTVLGRIYNDLISKGVITPRPEPKTPTIPMDYSWARQLGLIRKPTNFVSSISDERGDELLYAGMPLSRVFEEDIGVGGVISLLWFKRRLPPYATKFIEMVLMVTADHGPAVSGAHNTIVTARAGKDLISSLVSGLMTIGPRFGGAIDDASRQFSQAHDRNLSPKTFVDEMRDKGELIMGIGHRVKTLQNPDKRVVILKDYIMNHFPQTNIVSYALEVEKITTAKRNNLILNVDGLIGTGFVDLLRGCGAFTREEADEYLSYGCLNGLFVLGRSIGFIGHYLDQVRMKQPLYRHPWDDISYVDGDNGF